MAEPDELVDETLAQIAEGAPIDWAKLESSATSESLRALIADLRLVAGVAEASGPTPRPEGPSPSSATLAAWGVLRRLETIGSGAYGDVYRAWDPRLQRLVALKVLKPDPDGAHAATALRESRLLARIRHPHVVTVHTVEHIGDTVGIVMELVQGQSLADLVTAERRLSAERVARIGIDLCRALAAVHEAGLVHRDITARNVMIDASGRVVLMDFGSGFDPHVDRVDPAGTPLCLAPEIFSGGAPTAASDLYSAGVLLYHLLTGAYPVTGRTVSELADAHRARVRPSMRERAPEVPDGLARVIDRALATRPSDRYPNAGAMAEALQQWVDRRRATTSGQGRVQFAAWAVALALMVGAAVWRVGPLPSPAPARPRDFVLIVPFENRTGDPTFDGVVEALLDRALSGSPRVAVASAARIDDALALTGRKHGTPLTLPLASELAVRDGGIVAVIDGAIRRRADGLVVDLSVRDPATGATMVSASALAPDLPALPRAVSDLASRVRGRSAEAVGGPSHAGAGLERVTTASLRALTLYSQSYRMATRSGENTWPAALALVREAVRLDPEFPVAWTWLAWTLYRTGAATAEYVDAAARAVSLSDRASEWERHWIRGSHALLTRDDERAAGEYERLLALEPDHYWGVWNLYTIYLRLGRDEDAVQVARAWVRLRPMDDLALYRVVEALGRNGEFAETVEYATRALSLVAPGGGVQAQSEAWLALVPAFEAFASRDVRSVAAALETVGASLSDRAPAAAAELTRQLSEFHMALGQVRVARETAGRLIDPLERTLTLADGAYFAGNLEEARRQIAAWQPGDQPEGRAWLTPRLVWLHIRTGSPQAGAVLTAFRRQYPNAPRPIDRWVAGEMSLKQGRAEAAVEPLMDARAQFPVGNSNWYLASAALGEACLRAGRTAEAARVFEQMVRAGRGERQGQVAGRLWMPAALELARLRVAHGDTAGARDLVDDLDRLLALADPGFPLREDVDALRGQLSR